MKRLVTAKKQEQLTAQAAEKKGREDVANQKVAARQAVLKKDADRWKYIWSLQTRFAGRVMPESRKVTVSFRATPLTAVMMTTGFYRY
jgi:hypothetical protein